MQACLSEACSSPGYGGSGAACRTLPKERSYSGFTPAGPAFILQITSEIIGIIIGVIFPLPGGQLLDLQVWVPAAGNAAVEV